MTGLPGGFGLGDLSVRPVRGPDENARWRELMDELHYLGLRSAFGSTLKQVAVLPDGGWAALVGWTCGAFKTGARDRWIGWERERQFRRLHLIANNNRFLVLPGYAVPNLASRVLGLSARRLCGDMLARRGHPVLLAETFVDPALYRGTCYRAAGWEEVGETRGYARRRGGWEEHGCRKRVFVKPLAKAARTALSGGAEPSEWGCPAGRAPPPGRMRSLYGFLRPVPDYRSARGVRHRLATVLAIALASKLAGVRGVTAIAEFADRLTQAQLAAVRARLSPSTGRRVPPSRTSFHRILSELDPDALERALREWAALGGTPGAPVAVDGKSAPGWVRGPSGDRMLVAAVEHGSGVTLGQTASDSAGSEIVGARRLLSELDIRGRVVTLDVSGDNETAGADDTETADFCSVLHVPNGCVHAPGSWSAFAPRYSPERRFSRSR